MIKGWCLRDWGNVGVWHAAPSHNRCAIHFSFKLNELKRLPPPALFINFRENASESATEQFGGISVTQTQPFNPAIAVASWDSYQITRLVLSICDPEDALTK